MNSNSPSSPTSPTLLVGRDHERLLSDERVLLDRLVGLAAAIDPGGPNHENAQVLRRHLEERLLLVIVGEVKAGKSSFINALLGREVCAVGPTPLTDTIQLLGWGEQPQERRIEEHLVERDLDVELLRDVSIVDTPGTNSILTQHSALTERFIPRADLVLFLTSIDRPYSESEDAFLALIADKWRKKVVFLLTKIDGRDPDDVRTVTKWVQKCVLERHGFEPVVLPFSARLERQGDDGGLARIRDHVRGALSGGEKTRLKLDSPVRSAQSIVESLGTMVEGRNRGLDGDFRSVQDLDRQLEETARDLKERSHRFVTEAHDHFGACARSAAAFFGRHARWKELAFGGEKTPIRDAFEKEVLSEFGANYTATMQRALDWLTREEISLYERCSRYLHEKVKPDASARALPAEPARFEYRRDQIVGSLLEGWQRDAAALDVRGDPGRFLASAQSGMRTQLALSVGALGVGAGSIALLAKASTIWFNVAGLALALGLGLTGLAVLPAVRRRSLRKFSEKLEQLEQQVRAGYLRAVEEEVDGARDRLRRSWEPFLIFHRAEATALAEQVRGLEELRRDLANCRDRVARSLDLAGPDR